MTTSHGKALSKKISTILQDYIDSHKGKMLDGHFKKKHGIDHKLIVSRAAFEDNKLVPHYKLSNGKTISEHLKK